jgi:hypothetical protein
MVGVDLLIAAFYFMPGDLVARNIDSDVDRLRKGWSFLDVVVTDELKNSSLPEDGDFVVDGAIAKMKDKARTDLVSIDQVDLIASGEDFALCRLEKKEAVTGALLAPRLDWVGGHGAAGSEAEN